MNAHCRHFLIVVFVFLSINNIAFSKFDQNSFNQELQIFLKNNPKNKKKWELLESIGWQFKVKKQNNNYKINYGKPLQLNSFNLLPDSKCKLLCISINSANKKEPLAILSKLFQKEIKTIIDHDSSKQAYRLKIASGARDAALKIGRNFKFPDEDYDSLGTGFTSHFQKQKATIDDLKKASKKRQFSNYSFIEEIIDQDVIDHVTSYKLRPDTNSFLAIKSLFKECHTAGCMIALNSILTTMMFDTYNDSIKFLETYDDITINNGFFFPSKLFPNIKRDTSGLKKAKLGRNALIGEGMCISSIIEEKVTDYDYVNENIIITKMSDKAVNDLKHMNGLGHIDYTRIQLDEFLDDEFVGTFSDPRLEKFSGVSKEMIEFWIELKLLMKATNRSSKALSILIQPDNDIFFGGKAHKHYKKLLKIIERPFFKETTVWGQPSGEKSLGEWMLSLAARNPNTPYSLFLYDYGLDSIQYENYKRTYLGKKMYRSLNKIKSKTCDELIRAIF